MIPTGYTNWFGIFVQVVLYQWYLYTPGVTSGYVFSPTCSDLSSPQTPWQTWLRADACAQRMRKAFAEKDSRCQMMGWEYLYTHVDYAFQPNLVAEFWPVSVHCMGNILYPRGVGFKHLSCSHHFCGEIILFDYCNIFWNGLKPPTRVWFRMKSFVQGVVSIDYQDTKGGGPTA